MHSLPNLPYSLDALSPLMSAETLRIHHGKHHKSYVKKLNELCAGTSFEGMDLRDVIRQASGSVFDNAAQHYNHSLFWQCLRPQAPDGGPGGSLGTAIQERWGSYDLFREDFSAKSRDLFGSGWCWLVVYPDGSLAAEPMSNAGCPITDDRYPLLVLDVWEHAYYIDYRNARKRYVEAFWKLANWELADTRFRLRSSM